MWAVIVTNQGVPVQVVLVNNRDDLDPIVTRTRSDWGLDQVQQVSVADRPIIRTAASVSVKQVTCYVDSLKTAKYFCSVISRVKMIDWVDASRDWQFCPKCSDPWLHHLSGPASLSPEDWDGCPCSDCGCKRAMEL